MAEYIKREEAIKEVENLPNCYNGFSDTYDKACIIGLLEEIPSADVAEVRHGEWELHGEPPWYVIECSKCGEKWHHWQGYSMPNFCPNCGADMRKDGE